MTARVFFSYSHADEVLRDRLEVALTMLKRQGVIETWHDRRIAPGDDFAGEIDAELERADIVLLLVSPDFLASDYCYDVEMRRALERHDAGEAAVVPVILRPCQWHDAPFGKLLATPRDGKPVTKHADLDDAFLEIANAIKQRAARTASVTPKLAKPAVVSAPTPTAAPRSGNLRLKRTFSDADADRFLDDCFEYMANYFENSLQELQRRNAGIETRFKRVDSQQFTASIYRGGAATARCRIFLGSPMLTRAIAYSNDDRGLSNGFNESVSVVADDQSLALQSLGFARARQHLTAEGAAEFFWSLLMAPLQR
jgi:hypothetical protein